VISTYCPLISFQANLVPPKVVGLINDSDAIFIKGANFFETFQVRHKETFYAFVVLGPISRAHTGLRDHDVIFAYVPAGAIGYVRDSDGLGVTTLREILGGSGLLYRSPVQPERGSTRRGNA
jgi:hypothetical protein